MFPMFVALHGNALLRSAAGSVLAIFCSGIGNTIGFISRTVVTLKNQPGFSKAQRTRSGSGCHG
jgi:hypothetical protein